MATEKKELMLTGRAHWAHIHTPNPKSEPKAYTMDLSIDEATQTNLEALGITVKNAKLGIGVKKKKPDDTRGFFVSFKRTDMTKDGKKLGPPQVIDGKLNKVSSDVLIGNGSEVNVKASIYEWKSPTGEKGKSLGLNAIQIKTLVKYEDNSLKGFNADGDYVTDSPVSATDAVEDDDSFQFTE